MSLDVVTSVPSRPEAARGLGPLSASGAPDDLFATLLGLGGETDGPELQAGSDAGVRAGATGKGAQAGKDAQAAKGAPKTEAGEPGGEVAVDTAEADASEAAGAADPGAQLIAMMQLAPQPKPASTPVATASTGDAPAQGAAVDGFAGALDPAAAAGLPAIEPALAGETETTDPGAEGEAQADAASASPAPVADMLEQAAAASPPRRTQGEASLRPGISSMSDRSNPASDVRPGADVAAPEVPTDASPAPQPTDADAPPVYAGAGREPELPPQASAVAQNAVVKPPGQPALKASANASGRTKSDAAPVGEVSGEAIRPRTLGEMALDGVADGETAVEAAPAPLEEAAGAAPDPLSADAAQPDLVPVSTGAPAPANAGAPAQAAVAGPATASQLAAQILRKIDGRISRFDVQLDPIGLGQVKVSVEIDLKGRLTASLAFERPESAQMLRAHAGVLQAALEQAGFDLSNGGLNFDTAADGRSTAGQDADQGGANQRGRAFNVVAEAAAQTDLAAAARLEQRPLLGVDIRI